MVHRAPPPVDKRGDFASPHLFDHVVMGRPLTKERFSKKKTVQNFVKQGTNPRSSQEYKLSIFHTESPTDLQISFDLDNNRTIPPETPLDTNQRPDIVIFSVSKKLLIWRENTIFLERNIVAAKLRKETRYAILKTVLRLKAWTVQDFTIEIEALSFIAK